MINRSKSIVMVFSRKLHLLSLNVVILKTNKLLFVNIEEMI